MMEGAGVSGVATAKGVAEREVAVVMVCNVSSAVAMLKRVDKTGLGMVVRAGTPALVMVEGSLIEGRTGLVAGFNNRLVDSVVVSYSSEDCISSCATSRGSHIWFVAAKGCYCLKAIHPPHQTCHQQNHTDQRHCLTLGAFQGQFLRRTSLFFASIHYKYEITVVNGVAITL